VRLPDFLIIGAMKSGTTSFYWDLLANPLVFMPDNKEIEALLREDAASPEAIGAYAAHFRAARPDQICGEASTAYTKRPTYEGVAARAKRVFGEGVKLIYVVREPVSRAISHHYHAFSWGECHGDVDRALRDDPVFIDYSRYAYQLEPWLDEFGAGALRIIPFEEYTADRYGTIAEVSRFLGVEPRVDRIREDRVFNKGDGRHVHRGALTEFQRSSLYRRLLRRVIPPGFRQLLYRTVAPKAPGRPAPPSIETVRMVVDRVREDVERLRVIAGREEPLWDLDAVLVEYARSANSGGRGPVGPSTEGLAR